MPARTLLPMLALLAALPAGEATPAAAPTPYPLTTCLVTGEALGSMGPPLSVVREGREIRLCCRGCLRRLDRDLPHYLARLAEAEGARQAP